MKDIESFTKLSQTEQIHKLTKVTHIAAIEFGIKVIELKNVSHSFNSTFCITDESNNKYSLRVNLNFSRDKSVITAEHNWLAEINKWGKVKVPISIKTVTGKPFAHVYSKNLDFFFDCTLADWIEGEEIADEPTDSQLFELGRILALMHDHSASLSRSDYSGFPDVDSVFMDMQNYLEKSKLITNDLHLSDLLLKAQKDSATAFAQLSKVESQLLIHADLHMGNAIQGENQIAIIDFDDAGFGYPSQDLSISIFYLRDQPEKEQRLLEGYKSVKELPVGLESTLERLLVARQLLLLNTLLVTAVADEIAFIPDYIQKVKYRLQNFSSTGVFTLN